MPGVPSRIRPDRPRTVVGFVPILLANLLPLVGVLRLGWRPETLVVIYALEVLFSFPFAGVKALFAQRPPRSDRDGTTVISVSDDLTEKRGRIQPVAWLPPIYPRNVPFALAVGGVAAWFGITLGIVLVQSIPVAEVLGRPEVAANVGLLIAG